MIDGVAQVSTVIAMCGYASSAREVSDDFVAIYGVAATWEVDLNAGDSHDDDALCEIGSAFFC